MFRLQRTALVHPAKYKPVSAQGKDCGELTSTCNSISDRNVQLLAISVAFVWSVIYMHRSCQCPELHM